MSMAFVRFGAGLRVTLVMLFLGGLMLVSGFGFCARVARFATCTGSSHVDIFTLPSFTLRLQGEGSQKVPEVSEFHQYPASQLFVCGPRSRTCGFEGNSSIPTADAHRLHLPKRDAIPTVALTVELGELAEDVHKDTVQQHHRRSCLRRDKRSGLRQRT
jgi:hypothetical protein